MNVTTAFSPPTHMPSGEEDKEDAEGRCGMLLKLGERHKTWKDRWFVLQDDKLWYFKSRTSSSAIGHVPLKSSVVRKATQNIGKNYCFEIITKDRVYLLVAQSHSDMVGWIRVLSLQTTLVAENDLLEEAENLIAKAEYLRSSRELPMLVVDIPSTTIVSTHPSNG